MRWGAGHATARAGKCSTAVEADAIRRLIPGGGAGEERPGSAFGTPAPDTTGPVPPAVPVNSGWLRRTPAATSTSAGTPGSRGHRAPDGDGLGAPTRHYERGSAGTWG